MPSLYPPIGAPTIAARPTRSASIPARSKPRCPSSTARSAPAISINADDCRTDGLRIEKSHWARAIDTAPFYAYPVRPGITFTYLGTRVDPRARMRMIDGSTAQNMFAAGEIMAGNILGEGYAAGVGMTIGECFRER